MATSGPEGRVTPSSGPTVSRVSKTLYSDDKADDICAWLANGRSLASYCRQDGQPTVETVLAWLRRYPDFAVRYDRAREDQADTLADEIIDIADDSTNDYVERIDKRTGSTERVLDTEAIHRSKLRVDSRKWVASKLKPRKYAERVTNVLEGGDKPVNLNVTDEDRRTAILALLQHTGAAVPGSAAALEEPPVDTPAGSAADGLL